MKAGSSLGIAELIGRRQGDEGIGRFLKGLDAVVGRAEKKGFPALQNRQACEYHNYKIQGISLCFEEGRLEAIHVYNPGQGYSGYKGGLPYNIGMGMSGRQVVDRLGEPDGKMGGGRAGPISIAYKDRGLQINFFSSDWEDGDNRITSVTIHSPEQRKPGVRRDVDFIPPHLVHYSH